jgi:hypothetical protein
MKEEEILKEEEIMKEVAMSMKDLVYPQSKKPVTPIKRRILIEREFKRRVGIGDDAENILIYPCYAAVRMSNTPVSEDEMNEEG